MAIDKAIDSAQLDADLTSVANAIRTKGGTSAALTFPAGFVDAVAAIEAGGSGGLRYQIGEFVLESDVAFMTTAGSGIPHTLGVAPEFVLIWTEDYNTDNPPTQQVNVGYAYFKHLIDTNQKLTSAVSSDLGYYVNMTMNANATVCSVVSPTSESYMPKSQPTESELYLYTTGSSNRWRAGVTYKYFIAESWWNDVSDT